MIQLAPDLFSGRRYDDLVQLGRSRLPRLAPAWTDHNVHDPGITLIELLAWVAEAQIYSLSRSRRDERTAYAALMGVLPNGVRPAKGLIWPDHSDPNSPSVKIAQSFVIEPDGAVHTANSDTPAYRPALRVRWIPARIRSLATHLANGTVVEHKGPNQRGGPAFRPFGDLAGRNDVLWMELEATGEWPLFPAGALDDARLVIGVRTVAASDGVAGNDAGCGSPLEVVLTAGSTRLPLTIVDDTTAGLQRTGYLALDLAGLEINTDKLTLEIRAPHGLDIPPRIVRIEPNVVPISQELHYVREKHAVENVPDFGFDLNWPGLEFEPGSDPVTVEVSDGGTFVLWKQCDRLSDYGPLGQVYELDPVAAHITFGNGINGQIPPAGENIFVSYTVSDGTGGNMARNRKWAVAGVTGVFGVNPDTIAGGEAPSGWLEQRREARQLVTQAHALISNADIEAAARALPILQVGRSWVMPAQPSDLTTGTTRLIAMQTRDGEENPDLIPETPRWLEAIRRALAPRLPLGSRFSVSGPSYVTFTLRAQIEAEPRRDPATVKKTVLDELRKRLTLVSNDPREPERAFGLPVTRRDITSWIQALADVRRVPSLQIVLADGAAADEVAVPRQGLPRIDLASSTINVARPVGGVR